jgi:hypothetical protein
MEGPEQGGKGGSHTTMVDLSHLNLYTPMDAHIYSIHIVVT